MKKIITYSLSILSCLSLHAAQGDVEALTKAVLDNNDQQVRSNLMAEYSQEDLQKVLTMAKEKYKFYQIRLNRWQKALKAAKIGLPLATILGIVAGIAHFDEKNYPDIEGKIMGAFGEPSLGGAAGFTTAITLVGWAINRVEKWKYLEATSYWIVSLIEKKLAGEKVFQDALQRTNFMIET